MQLRIERAAEEVDYLARPQPRLAQKCFHFCAVPPAPLARIEPEQRFHTRASRFRPVRAIESIRSRRSRSKARPLAVILYGRRRSLEGTAAMRPRASRRASVA